MHRLARLVVARRWWVLAAWVLLTAFGAFAAPRAVDALTYDFGLPGQPGYEANREVVERFGSGGDVAPLLLVVGDGTAPVQAAAAQPLVAAVTAAVPGARTTSFAESPELLSDDGTLGVVLVHYPPVPGPAPFAAALPALQGVAARASAQGPPVAVTGKDALAAGQEEGGGGADVLAETLFGAVGALVVLLLVFGSALAVMPLVVAAASILTTFAVVWALTGLTDISFIVQFLLSLIGLGVAIDYALLIVTRWREELGNGLDARAAVEAALATAGRSVLFSGVTVAVSLAALIVLPVPFLRSVGFTGLLIPLVSVLTSLTLLPALLLIAGRRLDWPHRRAAAPDSRAWRRVGTLVVRHRWVSTVLASALLLALASPVLGLRLGQPSDASLASTGGPAAEAVRLLDGASPGAGLTLPVEVLTDDPAAVLAAVGAVDGVAGALAPAAWSDGTTSIVEVWTERDATTSAGADAVAAVRAAAEATGARVGGVPAQDADFLDAVYGNAWWVVGLIVVVTFALLAVALRSVVLPLKALLLNVVSIAAAYGMTVLIWQEGFLTEALFDQTASGSITTWVPIAVFAFLFGLSMDYEVFLLSRIREEYDESGDTDAATVDGVARTGRLVSSAALILFLAFISLSRVPATEVKILATALALGIIIDATVVRGVLAPALVAALGPANWWRPGGGRPGGRRAPARHRNPGPRRAVAAVAQRT
ncbi:MMPL family transporter [Kineococcus gypseus]|uniref:MMPL family transporter n=1 Tax=Kineococcus gypseus TaxID=1637102 RepID=UPI003D7E6AFC